VDIISFMEFNVNLEGVERYEKRLRAISKKAVPFAEQKALNEVAAAGKLEWQDEITSAFQLRNNFILNSIKTTRANSSKLVSSVGSINKGMALQEFGGLSRPIKGKNLPIASTFAAGERRKSTKRKKKVRKVNRLKTIQLRKSARGGQYNTKTGRKMSNKQELMLKIRAAAFEGSAKKKFFYHKGPKIRAGIYTVWGSPSQSDIDDGHSLYTHGVRLEMVQDLSQKTATITERPTMRPAMLRILPKIRVFYARALLREIKSQKAFRAL